MSYSEFKTEDEFKSQCGYNIDGVWYPRVTRIVDMKSKPALYRFYGSVGYEAGKRISEKSAAEGTLVHEVAEQLLIGEIPSHVDPSIQPAMRGLWEFLQKNQIEVQPDHLEKQIHCKDNRYAGTLDALAKIGGKFGVLDIKTSMEIYRDYNIQTSAYANALQSEFPELKHRWILRIDQAQTCKRCGATRRTKGGREKIRLARSLFNGFNNHYDIAPPCPKDEHDWSDSKGIVELKELPKSWKNDFKAFIGAKALWEWENHDWLKKIGY